MSDKTTELLSALADKFGTTVEHLWGVMVNQAPISATIDALIAASFIVMWAWLFKTVKRKTICPPKTEDEPYPHADLHGENATVAWAGVIVAFVIAFLVVSCSTYEAVTAAFNPEYWALHKLLK